MLYVSLAEIIHKERQAEIERTLRVRRLLERPPGGKVVRGTRGPVNAGARQTPAGAAS